MHYNLKDETAHARAELSSYLEAQAIAFAIELTSCSPKQHQGGACRLHPQRAIIAPTINAHDTLEDNARLKPDFGLGISHSFAVVDPVQSELRLLAATIHFCWEAIAQTRLNQVAV